MNATDIARAVRAAGLGLGYTDEELVPMSERLLTSLPDRGELMRHMDVVLIAITDGQPIPNEATAALPPWRAVLLARVAAKAGVPLAGGSLEELVDEAARVGGAGTLAWPPAPAGDRPEVVSYL